MSAQVEDTRMLLLPSGCSEAGREQHSACSLGVWKNTDSCKIWQGTNTNMTQRDVHHTSFSVEYKSTLSGKCQIYCQCDIVEFQL